MHYSQPLSYKRKWLFVFPSSGIYMKTGGMDIKQLHIISNGKMPIEQLHEILTDIHPYVTMIHLREKQKSAKELFQAVERLAKDIPLSKIMINDRVDVAVAAQTAGVQLAGHSLDAVHVKKAFPLLKVGASIHSYEEAYQEGADFLLYGHVFPSKSKPGLPPKGLEELTKLSQLNIPVIAIGGITPENTPQVLQAGAAGIAVMSGVLDSCNPLSAVKAYTMALHKHS
jgi:thiazole tautomerase (transcriptional regulator TenI)